MDKKEFKTIVRECLVSNGFIKKGSFYYKESRDVICALGFQKSNYSNCYYINIGIFIKEIDPSVTAPRDVEGHIRSRCLFTVHNKETDCIDLDESLKEDITTELARLVADTINPSMTIDGLQEALQKYPVLLYQTTVQAKEYLGF